MTDKIFARHMAHAATEARHRAEQANRERTDYEARTANTIGLPPRPPARYDLRIDWHPEWSPLARWAVLSERRDDGWGLVGMWLIERWRFDRTESRGPMFCDATGGYLPQPSGYHVEVRVEADDADFLALCQEGKVPALALREIVMRVREIVGPLALSLDTQVQPARGEAFTFRQRWDTCGVDNIVVNGDGAVLSLYAAG